MTIIDLCHLALRPLLTHQSRNIDVVMTDAGERLFFYDKFISKIEEMLHYVP